MKTTVKIKSISGNVLFSYECEDNSIKKTLEKAVEVGANLSEANLREVNLAGANLSGADLTGADLSGSNLREVDLSEADLSVTNLRVTNLSGANLSGTYLSGANLSWAYLSGANLSGTFYNDVTFFLLSQCPSEGSFIAWKKARGYIVKLKVTENAKRSSATTLKCRCSEAEVLDIQDLDGNSVDIKEVSSNYDNSFVYKIGEIVKVDDFDENRFNECSTGIHFFIAREMAVKHI